MKRNVILSILAVTAGALSAVASGHVASPTAAVLAAFFWLRFFGHVRWQLSLVVFTLLHTAAWEFAYAGTVPLPVFARIPMFLSFSLVFALLFLLHVWAVRRRRSILATIVLPCGWVLVEYASAGLSPTGSWGSLAYTFLRWLPVAQLASVLGWVGITFFAVWIAALADLAVVRGIRTRAALGTAVLGVVVIAAVVGFGTQRIARAPAAHDQVRVAAVHGPTTREVDGGDILLAHYLGWDMADSLRARQPALAAAYRERLFADSEHGMGDAQLVVWAETLAWMSYDEEAAWIERGRSFAREHGVALAMGMSVFDPSGARRYMNKMILINGDGGIAWDFLKARPVPGAWHVVGDGTLPVADTPLGRIGGAICYDMDFPSLLGQAGRSGTELFLAPSFDDKEVRWMHARMADMRAIEQGFTLIRPAAFGVSAVTDPFGRRLAEKDAFAGGGFIMQATAPLMRISTVYSRAGDVFSWVCLASLLFVVIFQKMNNTAGQGDSG